MGDVIKVFAWLYVVWLAFAIVAVNKNYLLWSVILAVVIGALLGWHAQSLAKSRRFVGPGALPEQELGFGILVGAVYTLCGIGGIGLLRAVFGGVIGDDWFTGLSLMLLWLGAAAAVAISGLREKAPAPTLPGPAKPAEKAAPGPSANLVMNLSSVRSRNWAADPPPPPDGPCAAEFPQAPPSPQSQTVIIVADPPLTSRRGTYGRPPRWAWAKQASGQPAEQEAAPGKPSVDEPGAGMRDTGGNP